VNLEICVAQFAKVREAIAAIDVLGIAGARCVVLTRAAGCERDEGEERHGREKSG
jgi:hypothetical protein